MNISMRSLGIFGAIIALWVVVAALFLYSPYISFFKSGPEINIVVWSDLFDFDMIRAFEKQSGITVNVSYFENNEELLVKLKTTSGRGYDLLILSNYVMGDLIKTGLVQPLDKSKLNFWHRLDTRYLGLDFDPQNTYSVPYNVSIYGLGINKDYFKASYPHSWSLIFEQPKDYMTGMLDNPEEITTIASQYLFNKRGNLSPEQLVRLKETLVRQKQWVSSYSEFRADYLLYSQTSPVAIISAQSAMRLLNTDQRFDFIVPQEGGFMLVDSFVLSQATEKQDLVYQFLNFVFSQKVQEHHFQELSYFPTTVELKEYLGRSSTPRAIYNAFFNKDNRLFLLQNTIPAEEISDLWIGLKAS